MGGSRKKRKKIISNTKEYKGNKMINDDDDEEEEECEKEDERFRKDFLFKSFNQERRRKGRNMMMVEMKAREGRRMG
ncbi:hypothetical protein Pcinc_006703 [Petrolisthes cinctipes]|uniref:Uncharacterized protein n=1 Tax=Petrolisthes cinctipes TaxID=88211 RepID=A0AAE1GB17_PETCI|nr:hypothetical protein Pcinc_006703 [Petrolisthes cinctipes]